MGCSTPNASVKRVLIAMVLSLVVPPGGVVNVLSLEVCPRKSDFARLTFA